MIHEAGSGHPGGSLSCTDILAALYFGDVMTYDPAHPTSDARDRFIRKGPCGTRSLRSARRSRILPQRRA